MHALAQRDRLVVSPLLLATVLVALGSPPRVAHACSCSITSGPARLPAAPSISTTAFPTNALFTSVLQWHDERGERLRLLPDAGLSDALGYDVRRPVDDIAPGSIFFLDDGDCPRTGPCEHRLVFGDGPDTTAPSAAELVDVTIEFAGSAPETGVSCQVDSMILEVGGTDDITPQEQLTILAFVGATEEEVASAETFSLAFASDGMASTGTIESLIRLGGAEGHRRDDGPLTSAGPFCFAVALMDWAGNIGERSATRCLDTTDAEDPAIELVPYAPPCSGAFCSTHPGGSSHSFAVALAMLAMLGLSRASTRRRAR